jgi:hypothetical protein
LRNRLFRNKSATKRKMKLWFIKGLFKIKW